MKHLIASILIITSIGLLTSCDSMSEQAEQKMIELANKTMNLDSLVNREVDKVATLDSMINQEGNKVRKLDSLAEKTLLKLDSIWKRK